MACACICGCGMRDVGPCMCMMDGFWMAWNGVAAVAHPDGGGRAAAAVNHHGSPLHPSPPCARSIRRRLGGTHHTATSDTLRLAPSATARARAPRHMLRFGCACVMASGAGRGGLQRARMLLHMPMHHAMVSGRRGPVLSPNTSLRFEDRRYKNQ